MGARATGLLARRAYSFDALTTLVGAVKAGTRGRAAETRTGTAQLLTTRLECQDVFKIVINGQTATSAGGYLIEAAHVPEGGAIGAAVGWATIAIATCAPGVSEVAVSGVDVEKKVRTAGSITGDVRVVAVRATAGTGSNGAAAPAGTNTIRLVPLQN